MNSAVSHENLPRCYRQVHYGALNKLAGRTQDAKEFLSSINLDMPLGQAKEEAVLNRWFGNMSEGFNNYLFQHFTKRFLRHEIINHDLKSYLESGIDFEQFAWVNHLFMILDDPYYRWASSKYLPQRLAMGFDFVSRDTFLKLFKSELPEKMAISTSIRYGQNCLAALTENGFLSRKQCKTIESPNLTPKTLAVLLHILSQIGISPNQFNGSPLHRSLLKSPMLLLSLFSQGEREGYWEYNGDSNHINLNLKHSSFSEWLEVYK